MVLKLITKNRYLPLVISVVIVGIMFVVNKLEDNNKVVLNEDMIDTNNNVDSGGDHMMNQIHNNLPPKVADNGNLIAEHSKLLVHKTILSKFRSNSMHNIAEVESQWNNLDLGIKLSNDKNVKYICNRNKLHVGSDSILTLFTTVYGNITPSKYIMINNTLTIWSNLQPKVKLVLFVALKVDTALKDLVKTACAIGWTVTAVPEFEDNLPVLKFMYESIYHMVDTPWYGYADNTVLFDKSLMTCLQNINHYYSKKIKYFGVLAGDSHSLNISEGASISRYNDVYNFHKNISQSNTTKGPAYIITKRYGFPWASFPRLVVGQSDIGSYLLWFSHYHRKVFEIDTTDAIFAVQQIVTKENNTQETVPEVVLKSQETLNITLWHYNEKTINSFKFSDKEEYLNKYTYFRDRYKGVTKCMQYKFGHVNSPYFKLFKKILNYVKLNDGSNNCVFKTFSLVSPDKDLSDEFDMNDA